MLTIAFEQRYGGFTLAVDLALPAAGVSAVFGRSGSGKTLLLRALAGLDPIDRGTIRWRDEAWQHDRRRLPPAARRIGYVPQEPGLFPHLDVRGNLEYGLRRCAAPRLRFDDVVELLGVGPLLPRPVTALSGGQRQRIAIGRALLASPVLLALDEPMAALDAPTRRTLLADLRRLQRELALPMLYVSHLADEIERIADRVVFIDQGRISGLQSIEQLSAALDSPLFADDGPIALFDAEVIDWQPTAQWLELVVGDLRLHAPARRRPDGPVRMRIAARDVALALQPPAQSSFQNVLPVRIDRLHDGRPGLVLVRCVTAGGLPLLAELTARSVAMLGLAPGQQVYALIKAAALLD